jgi:hypothetical protein
MVVDNDCDGNLDWGDEDREVHEPASPTLSSLLLLLVLRA